MTPPESLRAIPPLILWWREYAAGSLAKPVLQWLT